MVQVCTWQYPWIVCYPECTSIWYKICMPVLNLVSHIGVHKEFFCFWPSVLSLEVKKKKKSCIYILLSFALNVVYWVCSRNRGTAHLSLNFGSNWGIQCWGTYKLFFISKSLKVYRRVCYITHNTRLCNTFTLNQRGTIVHSVICSKWNFQFLDF